MKIVVNWEVGMVWYSVVSPVCN